MDKDTLNISRWWPDNPIPIYHSKDELEPNQIFISTAGAHSDTYNRLMSEYNKLINATADEIIDQLNSIGCTSFMLTPEQIEQLMEQYEGENQE